MNKLPIKLEYVNHAMHALIGGDGIIEVKATDKPDVYNCKVGADLYFPPREFELTIAVSKIS